MHACICTHTHTHTHTHLFTWKLSAKQTNTSTHTHLPVVECGHQKQQQFFSIVGLLFLQGGSAQVIHPIWNKKIKKTITASYKKTSEIWCIWCTINKHTCTYNMKNQNAITAVDGRFLADEDLGKVYGATKLESTHCVLFRTRVRKYYFFTAREGKQHQHTFEEW